MKFILGLKLGMSQIFDEKGNIVPVTLIEAGPCSVLQIKTEEKDGYKATQIGFKKIEKKNKIKKPQAGKPFRFVREFKDGEYKVGEEIDVNAFEGVKLVKVSSTSKGKGFQGPVKKWGFSGRNATHGVKHEHRTLGSVGFTGPQRVLKGKKMAGRMGFGRVTVKNLKLMKIDKENNLLIVRGAVPGSNKTLVEISG